jgi:hypothetical protein
MLQKSAIKYILPESENILLDYTSKRDPRYQSIQNKLAYNRWNLKQLLDSLKKKLYNLTIR